jgi:hypothetical protein
LVYPRARNAYVRNELSEETEKTITKYFIIEGCDSHNSWAQVEKNNPLISE